MSAEIVTAALAEHSALVHRVSGEMTEQIDLLARLVLDTLAGGGRLLVCGNGGSAADAQHLAAELVVRVGRDMPALAALALTTDGSVLTAGANDLGFDRVFARQVEALGRAGDLLLSYSTSGESANLILAAEAARDAGLKTAALLAKGGGRLGDLVDLAVVVPTESTARAQEMHATIGHIVCEVVDRGLAG